MPLETGDLPWNERVIEDFRANAGRVTFPPYVGANLLLLTSTGAGRARRTSRHWATPATATGTSWSARTAAGP